MSGGGGGGAQPTSSTVTQTNIPEYARPYVESMLGATMGNLFRTKDVPAVEAKAAVVDDQGNVVTPAVEAKPAFKEFVDFKEFQPYSKNAADYFAVFSPEQQGVFSETARLGRPVGYDAARTMAGQAGQGGISSAGAAYGYGGEGAQFGRMGAGIGRGALGYGEAGADIGQQGAEMARMGFGAGKRYEEMATDPRAMQSYMSPYMRNVIDTQKQSAIRDYQENVAPQLAASATRAGAFGGTRDAVQRALGKRSLTQQLQNIEATGTQKAFEDAQRSQQFGAQLGLQGLGAGYEGLRTGMAGQQLGMQGIQGALAGTAQGMQGAGMGLQGVSGAQAGYSLAGQQGANLANIAGQELTSDISRLGFQGKTAAEKQSRDQAIINQEIQNFAQTQEYPRQSLSFMNAMLRGLPMQATTTQSYMPAPSPFSQFAGMIPAAYGAGRMAGVFKEGGQVKNYNEGGIASIDQKVINDPTSFSSDMINKGIASGAISKMAGAIGLSAIENAQNQAKQQQGLTQGAPSGTILGQLQQKSTGIDELPSNLPTKYAASGGIIAFAGEDGSLVEDIVEKENREIAEGTRLTYSPQAVQAMKSKTKDGNQEYLLREQQRMLSGNPMMSSYRERSPASTPAAALATPAAAQAAAYPQEGTRGTASMTRPGGPPGMDLKQVPPAVSAAVPTAPQTSAGPAAPPSLSTDEDGTKQLSVADFKRQQKEFGISEDPMAEAKAKIASMAGESKLDREFAKNMAFLRAGLGIMGGTSQFALQNISKGAIEGVTQYAQDIKDIKSTERELFKLQSELAKADDARMRGDFKGFQEYNQNAKDHMLKLKKLGLDERQVKAYEKSAGRPSDEQLRQQMFREDPAAFRRMQESMRPGFESAQTQRDKAMLEQINNALLTMKKDDPQRKMLEEQRQRIMGRMSGQVEALPPNVQAVIDKHLPRT